MSPLATWVIHCPYGPGISAPVKEDQHEGGSSYGMMHTHTPRGLKLSVSIWPASETLEHWYGNCRIEAQ